MSILPFTQILKLHAAVVSAQLTSSRAALLGGIDPAFADGLPTCANPSSQILSDLHGLNAAEQLSDGAVPFRIWLGNALALVGQRAEADVFRRALAMTEPPEAPTRPRGGQRSPQQVHKIADELEAVPDRSDAFPCPVSTTPSTSRPTRASIRKLLGAVLKGDSDFDAFCLDHFPAAYERFSAGMDRARKVNILFERTEPATLLEQLRRFNPPAAAAHEHLVEFE